MAQADGPPAIAATYFLQERPDAALLERILEQFQR
jgi:hypothetical protein